MYELVYGEVVMGTLGECTDYGDYRVGDLLIVSDDEYESEPLEIVLDGEVYKVLGFLAYDLKTLHEIYNVEKVASYKLLNYDNIKKITAFNLSLREKEIKKTNI